MKKFFLLLILVLTMKGYGQTYTMEILIRDAERDCNHIIWSFTDLVDEQVINRHSIGTKTYTDVPNSKTFKLSAIPQCELEYPAPPCASYSRYEDEVTTIQLIRGYRSEIIGCYFNIGMQSFKPNVTISKRNDPSSSTICSGFTLNLGGFPADFPNEAYHWQYSFDGLSNWVDVRADKNDTPETAFSIQDILGDSHVNHFGKQIYFRLGYGQDRPFTEPLAITYSSCAPVAEEVVYVPPRCNGDAVNSIEVYFDRKLDPNENLYPIYILSKNPKPQQFFQAEKPVESLVFDLIKQRYKYSFTKLTTLVHGDSYVVVYQARIGEAPRGLLTTSSKGFPYEDPAKLEFVITKQTPPSCFGGEDGSIEIMVTGGVAPYCFYKDGVELKDQLYPTFKEGKYSILGLKANAKGEGYKIKVTDTNDCIEKPTP
jgi:hypothetical protein